MLWKQNIPENIFLNFAWIIYFSGSSSRLGVCSEEEATGLTNGLLSAAPGQLVSSHRRINQTGNQPYKDLWLLAIPRIHPT